MKGTGIVVLFALPFYGFSALDALLLTLRSGEQGGARYHAAIEAPEAVLLSDGGCGDLCQELLLEDQVGFVEALRSELTTKYGLVPLVRYEKLAGRDQCDTAHRLATPLDELDLHAKGLVELRPKFANAIALNECISFEIVKDPAATVMIHVWPKNGPHVPFYLGDSNTVHHQIYRRGPDFKVTQMLAESESGWVEVLDFPPRIRFSEPPEETVSFSTRLSYGAPGLAELVSRTLSLDLNGQLDFAATAAPTLIVNIRSGEATVRVAAATALRDLVSRRAEGEPGDAGGSGTNAPNGTSDRAWIAPLTAALADENPTVRRTTAEALGAYGPAAQSAVPRLISALGDKDEGIADQARLTLSKVGEGSVRHLVGALNHRNGEIRIGAVRTLATIGPAAQAAGPALLALLDADDGPLRATAAWALGKIHWLKAVPRLLSAIESSDRKLRDSAKSALSRMGAAAVPGLIDKLGHDDEGVRLRVVDALGAIGPAARDALPALREVMGPEPKVNYRWAIERIEGKRKTP